MQICSDGLCRNGGFSCGDSIDNSMSEDEFCSRLRHIKCKVARLAREQMQKKKSEVHYRLDNISYGRRTPNGAHVKFNQAYRLPYDHSETDPSYLTEDKEVQSQEFQVHSSTITDPTFEKELSEAEQHPMKSSSPDPTPGSPTLRQGASDINRSAAASEPQYFRHWFNQTLYIFWKQRKVILAALILGVLVWMALVYGALLGASLCGNNRPPFPILHFGSSRMKHLVF